MTENIVLISVFRIIIPNLEKAKISKLKKINWWKKTNIKEYTINRLNLKLENEGNVPESYPSLGANSRIINGLRRATKSKAIVFKANVSLKTSIVNPKKNEKRIKNQFCMSIGSNKTASMYTKGTKPVPSET